MAVTHNRYKFVTVSLPKRMRDGRFASETAVRCPGLFAEDFFGNR
jgi:hypothetical protein